MNRIKIYFLYIIFIALIISGCKVREELEQCQSGLNQYQSGLNQCQVKLQNCDDGDGPAAQACSVMYRCYGAGVHSNRDGCVAVGGQIIEEYRGKLPPSSVLELAVKCSEVCIIATSAKEMPTYPNFRRERCH